MKLMRRCVFCDSVWVKWNIKLEMTKESAYAHDCYACGRVHLTDHRVYTGMPALLLAGTRKVQMRDESSCVLHETGLRKLGNAGS